MNARRRLLLLFGASLLLGALANLAFGPSPAKMAAIPPAPEAWGPLGMRLPDLAAADAGWKARTPRGAPPPVVEPPPPPPPPPPTPVGIIGSGRTAQAIFLVDGSDEFHGRVGAKLPDGGRILAISGMIVDWVDGAGARHSRRMFVDPPQLPE